LPASIPAIGAKNAAISIYILYYLVVVSKDTGKKTIFFFGVDKKKSPVYLRQDCYRRQD
jgi:hypothetical protein